MQGIAAVYNEQAILSGEDAEGDEALRQRLLDSFRQVSNGTNQAFYYDRAMSYPGVRCAKVVPRVNGVNTVGILQHGDGVNDALNAQMQKAEASRASAENQRAASEKTRQTAETGRAEAEKKRAAAESARVTEAAQLKPASQAATAAATGAASNADAAANTALQIANSVAQGSAGSSDMAKQKQQIADLYGKLADATDAFIYDDGTVYCPASKASASGSTVTFGSTCTASGTTLNLK